MVELVPELRVDWGNQLKDWPHPCSGTDCCMCALLREAARTQDLEAEVKLLKEVQGRPCHCSVEDACAFARERDAAKAEVENHECPACDPEQNPDCPGAEAGLYGWCCHCGAGL